MKNIRKCYNGLETMCLDLVPECAIMVGSLVDEVELKVEVDEYITIENAVSFD